MVCACLVATVLSGSYKNLEYEKAASPFEVLEGVSEEEAYLNGKNSVQSGTMVAMRSGVTTVLIRFTVGEYKTILQLVGLLSHGKLSKRIADRAINATEDVQNLRKAVYE